MMEGSRATRGRTAVVSTVMLATLLADFSGGTALTGAAADSLAITEFMATNRSVLKDGDGEAADWIEVQNLGASSLNLAGWSLTDEEAVRVKWTFPALELPAGGILIVFASGKDRRVAGGELHTNFRLDGDAEYLALVTPEGTIAQEFAPFPKQEEDVSYGSPQAAALANLISTGASGRMWVPTSGALGLDWTLPDFVDSAWTPAATGIGFDINDVEPPLGDLVNLAPRGTASQSTIGYGGFPERAIDGNTNGSYGNNSVSHTADGDPLPTWEVDLEESFLLQRIVLWNRSDCCSSRLTNFQVSVFVDPESESFSEVYFPDGTQSPPPGGSFEVDLPAGTRGRFVRVELLGPSSLGELYLSLAEVQVFGWETSSPGINLALGKKAVQSSTALGGLASRAVDGNTDGDYAKNSVTHTSPTDPTAYWQVDLGETRAIGRVELWNRQDCCAERLSNFRLAILDSASMVVTSSSHFTDRGSPAVNPYPIAPPARTSGRFVKVEKLGPDKNDEKVLSLAEVKVFEPPHGYRSFIRTDVEAALRGKSSSIYLRVPFTVADPASLGVLILRIRYDDAFTASINGREVARRNAPPSPAWDSQAASDRPDEEGAVFEEINISGFLDALLPGTNVLALHGLTTGPDDADFLLAPELAAAPAISMDSRYFVSPTPGRINNTPGLLGFVGDTVFSIDRGYYETPFEVEIATATPGATIRYTTDGSAPTETTGTVYAGAISIQTTTMLRAAAYKDGFGSTDVDTQTYIFAADVVKQTGAGFPTSWVGTPADYGMDPNVVNDARYKNMIAQDLQTIPALSIVMKTDDLFGARGIYSNSEGRGDAWERPCSIELIVPEGSHIAAEKSFQENCGVRIYGYGWRPHSSTKKHAFRLIFRREYGAAKLKAKFFPDFPVRSFDSFVLRSQGSKGWNDFRVSIEQTQYIHDAWARYTERAMGNLTTSSTYVQLYLNGLYWGLYNPVERPDAEFMAEHLGGSEEDYDSLNARVGAIEVIDGSRADWDRLIALVKGNASTPAAFRAVQGYLDVPNLINFTLISFYAGNQDWVGSNGNNLRVAGAPNAGGYRCFSWDFEYSFFGAADNVTSVLTQYDTPALVHARLSTNPEYRMLYADLVHRHFFHDGALTPAKAADRWIARANEIDRAIVGESARWGDARREPPYTRDVEWIRELNRLKTTYFPSRTQTLLNQLKAVNLYPSVAAPEFSQHGGTIQAGFLLSMTAAAPEIHITLDGTDPRLEGGAISPDAFRYTGPIALTESTLVKARARSAAGVWSALNEAVFILDAPPPLRITEVHYNPEDPDIPGFPSGEAFEFLEVKNVGPVPVSLEGVRILEGVTFEFSSGDVKSLAPGELVLVAKDVEALDALYDLRGLLVAGEYKGQLKNGADRLRLEGALGETILDFTYLDTWHPPTDGGGYSLTIADPLADPAAWGDAASWRASALRGGSPGWDESDPPVGGFRLPSDANQDRRLDLTDAIALLRILFLGETDPPPCEGPADAGGNLMLLNANADAALNLSDAIYVLNHLFRQGPAPLLGQKCTRIEGCADACGG